MSTSFTACIFCEFLCFLFLDPSILKKLEQLQRKLLPLKNPPHKVTRSMFELWYDGRRRKTRQYKQSAIQKRYIDFEGLKK